MQAPSMGQPVILIWGLVVYAEVLTEERFLTVIIQVWLMVILM